MKAPDTSPGLSHLSADKLLSGDPSQIENFYEILVPRLRQRLLARCWNGRSRAIAEDTVLDVISECFGGFSTTDIKRKEPLLRKFHGTGSLEGWLWRVVHHRYLNRITRSSEKRRIDLGMDELLTYLESPIETGQIPWDGPLEGLGSPAELDDLAFRLLQQLQNEDLRAAIWTELHFLHGIKKNKLASAWKVSPATVGRKIQKALSYLREILVSFEDESPDIQAAPHGNYSEKSQKSSGSHLEACLTYGGSIN